MAPKKRRQHVGALNYQKRKDTAGGARAEDGGRGSEEVGVLGSDEARVEGGVGSGEVRTGVESEIGSGKVRDEGEPGSSSYSKEEVPVAKRPRLSDISAMADEPIKSWLDHLPRDDMQHIALLLYTSYHIWDPENQCSCCCWRDSAQE